ncbi:hypothetical protein [Clostridium estertheticum]|uniref:hypothetical protein n=1 Tax=Clostridium estertheticum TaxID=238834 RepID=UPI001C0E3759|nr:hypothetical protein [Clostridium estertheticum]MBU3174408.1 hypothetical protein [Clostridium estertheticum]
MPRKKKGTETKIKVITGKDEKLFKSLTRIGLINHVQAKEYLNLSLERLYKLENSGYIKTSKHCVRGQNNLIIQLQPKGKDYCRQQFGIRSHCAAQTNHLNHDLKLTEIYFNIPEKLQDTWKHEKDLIKEVYENFPEQRGNLKTCIDARIENNGEFIAIESIGSTYSKADIELKENIATEFLGCERMERA